MKYSILDDLFAKNLINGQLNTNNYSITLDRPSLDEKIVISEFVDQVKENIPISIDRFAEKTSLEKERLETILPILIENKAIFGRYLDLEGVFIKRIKPTHQTDPEREIIYSCNICKSEGYISDDELVWCPNCINSFHHTHMLEWLKIQGSCPICQENVTEEALIKQKK